MRLTRCVGTALAKHFSEKIRFSGPVPIAEYMKTCLYHPDLGFYNKNPLGKHGHFITSPEITSLFGEMLGIWASKQWTALGCPRPVSFVELGPGRGLMCTDILKTFMAITDVELPDIHIRLVENSGKLKYLQQERLKTLFSSKMKDLNVEWSGSLLDANVESPFLLFANEFFDALPIHVFQKETAYWKEVLVGWNDALQKFELTKSRTRSASVTLVPDNFTACKQIELSFESGIVMLEIAKLLNRFQGSCLVIDYGHDSFIKDSDSFRAYKAHKQVDPLDEPGECDLTADVNFAYLRHILSSDKECDNLSTYGLADQGDFLLQLGIAERLKDEVSVAKTEKRSLDVFSSFKKITSPEEMGSRFKVFAIQNKELPRPPGFEE